MILVDYTIGFKLSWANFKKLHKASKQLYLAGNYGLACSLNILACEELIKSFVLHLKALHPEINFKDSEKIFHNHIFKHGELKGILESAHAGINRFSFDILTDKDAFLATLPGSKLEEYQKEYNDIERVKARTAIIKRSEIPVDAIFDWLDGANTEKNLGLYVGLDKHNSWQTPAAFKKTQYKKEKKYTRLLKLYIENTIDITIFMKELKTRGIDV